LSAPPDGQDLDEIIGELQSVWGVPQYPQEYRITIKVLEERDGRSEPATMVVEETPNDTEQGRAPGDTDMPIREKAPAAPLMRSRSQGDGARREKAPRRRRRRKGSGSGGGGGGGGGGNNGGGAGGGGRPTQP
jgi:uncharacterized membrane protein YgcG